MPFASPKQRRFLWAKKPDIARRWTRKYGSKPAKKGSSMPKGQPARPIRGKAAKGSGKSILMKEGAGRKMLKTWRSMSPEARKRLKTTVTPGGSLSGVIKSVRSSRAGRNVNPTTGTPGRNKRLAAGTATPKPFKLSMGKTPDVKPKSRTARTASESTNINQPWRSTARKTLKSRIRGNDSTLSARRVRNRAAKILSKKEKALFSRSPKAEAGRSRRRLKVGQSLYPRTTASGTSGGAGKVVVR